MAGLYDRQESLHLAIPERVGIVGVGGVGSWVAIFSAMSGIEVIHIWDSDRIEEHNLNRLPFKYGEVGEKKVKVVARFIKSIRPRCVVMEHGLVNEEDFLELSLTDVVFDCTDRLSIQRELSSFCKARGVRYIRAGYDGTHITITSSVPLWGSDESRGYHFDSSWVVPATTAAALAVGKALKYSNQEVGKDVGEI
jgi:tRNA A37 threonylcarbamoyladenosine dehydratase